VGKEFKYISIKQRRSLISNLSFHHRLLVYIFLEVKMRSVILAILSASAAVAQQGAYAQCEHSLIANIEIWL
jgi:hypothetical protein